MVMCWKPVASRSKATSRRCARTIASGAPILACRRNSGKIFGRTTMKNKMSRGPVPGRRGPGGAGAWGGRGGARAQPPAEVKVGLIVPLSGIYTRPGQVMRMGAEMGIEHINAQGGIKSLGGAKLKLVVIDCGDTTEKAKNAAQRMVAQETDLVAATGSYLSSFTLAVTEVTERAELPMLTLSYSDLLTERGFKFIFQTAAPASRQSELGLPELM